MSGMRKSCIGLLAFIVVIGLCRLSSASDKYFDAQAGDEVYACNCGKDCACQGMAKKPGNCACGREMVRARIVRSAGDSAILISDAWGGMRTFKTVGRYSCNCPDGNCGMVSQQPGNCHCGVEMK